MILRRLGTKKHIAHKIYPLFPKHTVYIEPFFGAGGMYFQKPRAKYNLLNDLDGDVFNLWQVVQERPDELFQAICEMPVHEALLQHWRKNAETDPIRKAMRFLMLSNFSFLGKGDTMKYGLSTINAKRFILEGINAASGLLSDCMFGNKDAIAFLEALSFKGDKEIEESFIYCDPPYLDTGNNYASQKWNADRLEDLILTLYNTKAPFAISEYGNKVVFDIAKEYNLNVIFICERRNLTSKERATEILMTNYNPTEQATIF